MIAGVEIEKNGMGHVTLTTALLSSIG